MIPKPKIFTREDQCNKGRIWLCFRHAEGFRRVEVAIAHSIIGVNVPEDMIAKERLTWTDEGNVEYYILTQEGERWLTAGFRRYLMNHPEELSKYEFLPSGALQ